MNTSTEKKQVVVIGAGAAGIAVATRLYENGICDIIILEAENRIGGRVNTVEIESGLVEMGAQWIHGEKDNVVYELAAHNYMVHDPTSSELERTITFVRSSGEIIEPTLATKMYEVSRNKVLAFDSLRDDAKAFTNYEELFNHVLKTELKKAEYSDMPDDLKSEFIEMCHQIVNSYDAADHWRNTSVSNLEQYVWNEGDQGLTWMKGYRALFNILTEKYRALSADSSMSELIALNTEVARISQHEQDPNVIIVECSNGRIFHADHVIITVSIGVLREIHTKLFEKMPIPELKIRSIENLGFGTIDKIYLEFSKPWWPNDCLGYELLWTLKDQRTYVKNSHGWALGIFAIIPVHSAPNALCCWVNGKSAEAMEKLNEKVVLNTVMLTLRDFLGQTFEIPDPVRILRSTWKSNEHFRGSYSSRTVRTDKANVSASTMSQPVSNSDGKPVLLFAGEATSTHHFGTVHGAVESGWREADRLIQYVNNGV